MARRQGRWRFTALLLLMSFTGVAWAETDAARGERTPLPPASEAPWTVTIVRLKHAKAEDLAATLSRILPPGVTVVPDRPTNSLLISAPSSALSPPIAPE